MKRFAFAFSRGPSRSRLACPRERVARSRASRESGDLGAEQRTLFRSLSRRRVETDLLKGSLKRPLAAVRSSPTARADGGLGCAVAGSAGRRRGGRHGWVSHGWRRCASRVRRRRMERARSRRRETKSADVTSLFPPKRNPREISGFGRRRARVGTPAAGDDGEGTGNKPTLARGPWPRCASACAARVLVPFGELRRALFFSSLEGRK